MSVLARIALTVAALWVVAVAAITVLFVLNPSETYIGDEARGRIIRADGLEGLTRERVYPESFNTSGYLVALAVATVVAGMIVLLAVIWTKGQRDAV